VPAILEGKMTQATKKLMIFMEENHFSPRDIYKAMIPIINPDKSKGKGRGEPRSSILGHPGASTAKRSVFIEDAEACFT